MTHVHASFDALWEPARIAQVADLVAALSPPLNTARDEEAEDAFPPAPLDLLPERSGREGDAASSAVNGPGSPPGAELPKVRPSSFLPRRIGPSSQRLRAMVLAAGRAIERLLSRSRHPAVSLPATATAPAAPLPPEEQAPDVHVIESAASVGSRDGWQEGPLAANDDHPSESATDYQTTTAEPAAAPATMDSARRRLDLPPEVPVILFAGHMAESSGIEILIDAIITVAYGDPAVHFVLAGSGSLGHAAEARAAAAHLGSRCRFTGDLDADVCRDYLTAADCVVVPAHAPATDGFADAALAAGKPVLTTHQAQLPAVCHGVNGLVAYDNPNSLVWGLRELLSMRAEHRSLFEVPRRVA
jgi:glycosyltransferase involved in cell wall biosynthesis